MNDRHSKLSGARWPKELRVATGKCLSCLACQNFFNFRLKELIVRDAKVELFVVLFLYHSILIIKKVLLELRFIFLFISTQALKNLNKCRFQLFCSFIHVRVMGKQFTFGTLIALFRFGFWDATNSNHHYLNVMCPVWGAGRSHRTMVMRSAQRKRSTK